MGRASESEKSDNFHQVCLVTADHRRLPQTTADQCIFVLIFDIKDTFYADLVLHACVSSSFRTLASILRCTLVSVTFYRYDFNKFDQSINQSFYCKKAWQNAHLDKKNTVKR